jgi:hypothetical protein
MFFIEILSWVSMKVSLTNFITIKSYFEAISFLENKLIFDFILKLILRMNFYLDNIIITDEER